MKVGFCIPTYNQTKLVDECLTSLREYYPDNNVIVTDDGSRLEIENELKVICKKHNAKLLASYWNNGFGANANRGIEYLQDDIIMLVNNDITFTCDVALEAVKVMQKDSKIGIVGFLLYYPNGRIQHGGHKRFPGYLGFAHSDHGSPSDKAEEAYKSRYIEGVTGALVALRKEMINKIGIFKTGYGLAYEDVELSLRAWTTDWRIYYTSKVSAVHHEGHTRGTNPEQKKALNCWKQEERSTKQFISDLDTYDMDLITQKVAVCNKEINYRKKKIIGINRKGALGDCIMATGVVEKIKKDNPNSEVIVSTVCPYPFMDNPNIDRVYDSPNILTKQADEFYDLDMAYEENINIPIWKAYANKIFGLNNYDDKDILPVLYNKEKDSSNLLNKLKINKCNLSNNFVVIHPTVSWPSRTWSKDNWEKVVKFLLASGYKVVYVGAGNDLDLPLYENVYNLKNKLELSEIRILINISKMFIGVDSGLMHIALTTKAPVIGLFTISDPINVIHRPEKSIAIVPHVDCKFCRNKMSKAVTFIDCKNNLECIKSIKPNTVIRGIKTILESKKNG